MVKGMGSPANCSVFYFNQRHPLPLPRPSGGRGPQLTPGVGSMVKHFCLISVQLMFHFNQLYLCFWFYYIGMYIFPRDSAYVTWLFTCVFYLAV